MTQDNNNSDETPQSYATTAAQQNPEAKESQPKTGATETPVGHVVVHDELVITHTGEDSHVKMFINRQARADVKTGSYIQVPYPAPPGTNPEINEELFAMVDSIRYLNDGEIDELTETMSGVSVTGETNERRYDQVADLKPIAILRKEETEEGTIEPVERKNVDAVPKPFTWAYKSTDEKYLRTGLNIPETGLSIGHMAKNGERIPDENDPLVYNISNPGAEKTGESSIFRHSLIAGSTGKGKTFFTKNYIRQLLSGKEYEVEDKNGRSMEMLPSVVIIDPENEYSEIQKDPNPTGDEQKEWLEKLKNNPNVEVGGIKSDSNFDLEPFVPNVKKSKLQNPPSNYSEFSIPFKLVHSNPQLAMPFDANEPTKNGMQKVLNLFFSKQNIGSAPIIQDETYDEFMNWLNHFNTLDFSQNTLAQQYGINEGVWDALYGRFDQYYFSQVFDSGSAYLTEITSKMFQPGVVSVIPTAHLNPTKERLVIMSLMSLIVENKIGSGDDDNIRYTPVILTVDEAHNFLGNSQTVQGQYITSKFRQIAKQGRKYKLGMVEITQNPEDIDEAILKQTNTKIYLGLEPEVLSKIPTTSIQNYINQIPNFGKGQAIVKAPDVKATEVLGYPVCLTHHSS